MTIPQLPRVVQRPTPNYTPVDIRHDLVVVHRCEGGYEGSVVWLCDRRANASAHLVMRKDGGEVTQLVPLAKKAWAQCAFNGAGISLEIEGFSIDGFPEEVARRAAVIVAWLCREYAIPPQWAREGQGRGICQHVDLGPAGGNHHDCTPVGSHAWLAFLGYVKEYFDAFGDGALPPFALHGLPEAHEVQPPPDALPEPSHGGAARHDPADEPLPSFAEGSVGWAQERINQLGFRPYRIAEDNQWGPQTEAAVAGFQALKHLRVDGVLGPETVAALKLAK